MEILGSSMLWAICVPLLGACALFVAGRRARGVIIVLTLAALAVVPIGLIHRVIESGPQWYVIGGWDAPLGIRLYADGVSVFMLALTAGVGLLVSIYALGYLPRQHESDRDVVGYFWPLWLLLWLALAGLYLSADLFNLYVTLELLGISSVALIALAGGPALTASVRYLLVTALGSMLYLLGVALLYSEHGMLDLSMIGRQVSHGWIGALALASMTLGLSLKTALLPLHFWLPPAHSSALGPVSAILSGLVVKASFYLLLRLWLSVFPGIVSLTFGDMIGVLGGAAIVWGSVQAMRQRTIKLLVAYSTVAQVGYLFMALPLGQHGGAAAWPGALYFAAVHACAKSAMFLAAGTIKHVLGTDDVEAIRGLGVRMPLTTFSFALAGVTLIGLPPTGGFIAKWMLLGAAVDTGSWISALVIVGGSLLAAAYVFPLLARSLRNPPGGLTHTLHVPASMQLATFGLALAGVLLGLLSSAPIDLLHIGEPFAAVSEGTGTLP